MTRVTNQPVPDMAKYILQCQEQADWAVYSKAVLSWSVGMCKLKFGETHEMSCSSIPLDVNRLHHPFCSKPGSHCLAHS